MSGDEHTRQSQAEAATTSQEQVSDAESEGSVRDEAEKLLDDMEEETELAGELARQLEEATRKAKENWDKLVRAQAEMENLRRRTDREQENARKYALEAFVRELLPVVDSLELGLSAASGESPDVAKLREGSELTLKLFLSVLEKFNVYPIDPAGEPFNPELHQAMAMEPSEQVAPNTVLRVFQKGYKLNDRLLRPALVIVAKPAADGPRLDEKA